jgi:hypothetical protein
MAGPNYTSSYNWTPDNSLPNGNTYTLELSSSDWNQTAAVWGPVTITSVEAEAAATQKHDDGIRIGLGVGVPVGVISLLLIMGFMGWRWWSKRYKIIFKVAGRKLEGDDNGNVDDGERAVAARAGSKENVVEVNGDGWKAEELNTTANIHEMEEQRREGETWSRANISEMHVPTQPVQLPA